MHNLTVCTEKEPGLRDGKNSTIRSVKDITFSLSKNRNQSVLIRENKKIHAGEILDATGLLSLEKECRSKPSGWKLNPHHFLLLEISHHFL